VRAKIWVLFVVVLVVGHWGLGLDMVRAPDVMIEIRVSVEKCLKAEYISRLIRVDTINLKFN
jgi:hypothetical protein